MLQLRNKYSNYFYICNLSNYFCAVSVEQAETEIYKLENAYITISMFVFNHL